jgi:hypothetical protein
MNEVTSYRVPADSGRPNTATSLSLVEVGKRCSTDTRVLGTRVGCKTDWRLYVLKSLVTCRIGGGSGKTLSEKSLLFEADLGPIPVPEDSRARLRSEILEEGSGPGPFRPSPCSGPNIVVCSATISLSNSFCWRNRASKPDVWEVARESILGEAALAEGSSLSRVGPMASGPRVGESGDVIEVPVAGMLEDWVMP